jgi:hypothetical protein
MPNRILRDWTDSEIINGLTVYAERFFTRLIMTVDDYGCFYADQRILKANLFPLKLDSVREADLLLWMAECQKAGLIVVYESSGKKYLQVLNFNQRLRIKKSKFPLPSHDGHKTDTCQPEVETNPNPNTEVEEKGFYPKTFYEKEEVKMFSIEHCIVIALGDKRWTEANKATEPELQEFNRMLEKQGVYEKNAADYKKHFGNWKAKGKIETVTNQTNGSSKPSINEALKAAVRQNQTT